MDPNSRKHTFELYGFDFMLDHNFKMQLIEVNTNPCLDESSEILKKLLPRMLSSYFLKLMLDDMFKLTLDQVFSA